MRRYILSFENEDGKFYHEIPLSAVDFLSSYVNFNVAETIKLDGFIKIETIASKDLGKLKHKEIMDGIK